MKKIAFRLHRVSKPVSGKNTTSRFMKMIKKFLTIIGVILVIQAIEHIF